MNDPSTDDQEITRVRRSKQEARATYDKIAPYYQAIAGFWERGTRRRGLAKLDVQEGEAILEIGPGTGHSMVSLAEDVCQGGQVWGIDISFRMCRIARNRLCTHDLSERATLICGDGARLPFWTASFDALFMSFTLELFDTPEIPRVLAECKRVLKGAGRIGVVSLAKAEGFNPLVPLYEWTHKQLPHLLDCRPIYTQNALTEADFQILDTERFLLWGLPVEIVLARASP
ncbi:MAG: methyltransferase domain-containing protein [Anaerolineae bacterium]